MEDRLASEGDTNLSLLDTLKDPPKQPEHKITAILREVSGPEQQALTEALSDPAVWPAEALARTLTASGHKVSASGVLRYRRGVLGITK